VTVLAKEDVEVHLHALQTINEQLQLCEGGHCRLEKLRRCCEITSRLWMQLIIQPVQVLPCSNSAMNGNNETSRILYHDIDAETITEPPTRFIVGT
jgi:hypothetical protein